MIDSRCDIREWISITFLSRARYDSGERTILRRTFGIVSSLTSVGVLQTIDPYRDVSVAIFRAFLAQ
jgi:hypothetical protein